jgi:RHS repeat-associated protein
VSYTRGVDLSGSLEGAGGIGGLLARSATSPSTNWISHVYYHADGNGNITCLMDTNQTVVASYHYDPYGVLLWQDGTNAVGYDNVYRFSSKEVHLNSGMYYYGYRFYDPNLQRWPNRDPFMEPGFDVARARRNIQHFGASREFAEQIEGPNLYEFVMNDPISNGDPFGLIFMPPQPPKPGLQHGGCQATCSNGDTATFGAAWYGNPASNADGQACCDSATQIFCGGGATAFANYLASANFSNCMRSRCGAPPSGQRPGGHFGGPSLPRNN